jgi:transcriptional regulator
MADPSERRGAILRLHSEGWNVASIAGYLGTTRRRVYETMKRWWEEGQTRPRLWGSCSISLIKK